MRMRSRITTAALLLAFGLSTFLAIAPAEGDGAGDRELAKAVERGQELWSTSFRTGAKSCRACHARGINKLTAERLKSYPKYDKDLRKVVTGQQKINEMIKKKGGGKPLELGSEDLNALEAFISTLK